MLKGDSQCPQGLGEGSGIPQRDRRQIGTSDKGQAMGKETTSRLDADLIAQLLKLGVNSAQDAGGTQPEARPEEVLAELLSNRLLLKDEKRKPGKKPGFLG